jgi:hypothetical protein
VLRPFFFNLLLGKAAADLDGLAGDPASGIRREEADDRCDFFRCAETPQRRAADQRVLVLLRSVGGEFGFDEARQHCIDRYAAGAEFHAVTASELFERAFGHLIDSEQPGDLRDVRSATGDIDDPAVIAHPGNSSLNREHRASRIDRDCPVEFFFGHVRHRGAIADTGIVDQDVERAEFFDRCGNEMPDFGDVGHVGLDRGGSPTGMFDGGDGFGGLYGAIAMIYDDRGACRCESFGNGAADAAGGASNNGDFVGQRVGKHRHVFWTVVAEIESEAKLMERKNRTC